MCQSSPPTPQTPDYQGLAQQQADQSLKLARIVTTANRPNQVTPYGTSSWSQTQPGKLDQTAYNNALKQYQTDLAKWNSGGSAGGMTTGPDGQPIGHDRAGRPFYMDGTQAVFLGQDQTGAGQKPVMPNKSDFMIGGNPDIWTQTTTLAPDQQALLDKQNQASLGLADQFNTSLKQVNSGPLDTSNIPALQSSIQSDPNAQRNASDAAYASATHYLDPQFAREQNQLESQLTNQGLQRGTEAWTNAMNQFNEGKGQAYDQARNQAWQQGLMGQNQSFQQGAQNAALNNQTANQQLQQNAYLYSQPLNNLNALRTGAQVTNPQFSAFSSMPMAETPNLMGAAQAGYNAQLGNYNAQQAGNNNMMGGLFSLGSAVLGAPQGGFLSGLMGGGGGGVYNGFGIPWAP